MMGRRTFGAIVMGGVTALLSGCGLSGNPKYRFKMTVEVNTPQGLKTGSSVYQVETTGSRDLVAGGKGSRFMLRGEAVAVDLGEGRTLFALLRMASGTSSDDNVAMMSMMTLDKTFDYNWMASTKRIVSGDGITSPAEVPAKHYPMLVVFKDIKDPKSVQRVEPDALDAAFGPGVKLRRITVAVTDEAVTSGIGVRLGWLGNYYAKRLDGQRFGDGLSFANSMSSGAFSTGASK